MSPVDFKKWQCPLCLFLKFHCRFLNTVVPLYTAPLTSGHLSYAASFKKQGGFSLYIYPSPTATPLTRPAATLLVSQMLQSLPLTNGHFSLPAFNFSAVQINPTNLHQIGPSVISLGVPPPKQEMWL